MKLRKIIIGALIASCSAIVNAEVTIKTDDTVSILSVNASSPDITSKGFLSSERTVNLPDGVSQIVFKYEPYFDAEVDGQERTVTVSSKAIIARFEATNTELTFDFPSYKNVDQAEADIENLHWSLNDKSGAPIAVVEDVLIKGGVQVSRNYSREAEDYNRKGRGVAVIAPFGSSSTVVAPAPGTLTTTNVALDNATTSQSSSTPENGNTAEEMLLFWYHKADAQTQARFREYVNQ
ncbi:DUF2057 family protein [Vibrio sp. WJH972]